jgi:two-component system, chemotaxis family, protein-glutamate methylesterase/glutaminase
MATDPKSQSLTVLVVDDTALYRRILSEVVKEISGAELIGTASNGRLGLESIRRLRPNAVLLDVEMPEMNGLETLEQIRREFPEVGVVMISSGGKRAADITVAALEKGALDFITKPDGAGPAENHKILLDRLSPILWTFNTKRTLENVRRKHLAVNGRASGIERSLKERPRLSAGPSAPQISAPEVPRRTSPNAFSAPDSSISKIDIVVIGVSTGGPNALGVMVPDLPNDLGVPVLIVQHMPPVFTASLAKSLEKKSKMPVVEAFEEQIIEPNTVYIAPGGKHMVVRREKNGSRFVIGLNENPPENSCRPAVDVLFRSVATMYGKGTLAVIMTGMGQDGLNGVKTLKQRGCYCLTQDEASCTIYGMPMVVDKAGLSDESIPLASLAARITAVVKQGAARK